MKEYLPDNELEEVIGIRGARKLRRDLALFLHSHTAHPAHGEKPSDFLRPSIPDLEIAEQISNYNPDCVYAILVAEEKLALASILFYQRSNAFKPFYQALDREPPAPKMVSLMQKNGFKIANAHFRYQKKVWKQPTLAALRDF